MGDLTFSSFFNLKDFEHKELFHKQAYVWNAISQIEPYLKQLSWKASEGKISSQAILVFPEKIFIGKGSIVEPGAYIEGPCFIGENNTIRHGAYIRGNIITSKNCIIGHATEVKNSIFLEGARAAHFNYVGDSILGRDVNLGAGAKLANFRLDEKEISLFWNEKKLPTNRKKLGAILGDGVKLGCNCVTNPGTLIFPNNTSPACQVLSGVIKTI